MRKLITLTALSALVSMSAHAQQQEISSNESKQIIALQDCTRIKNDVVCSFLFKNKSTYPMREYFADYNITLNVPNAQSFPVTAFQFSNGAWASNWDIRVPAGMTASGKLKIPNLPGDTITELRVGGGYTPSFRNIKIIQPQADTSLPGMPTMRQRTRLNDSFYTVLLHSCYPVLTKATCLVSLLADKPAGKRANNTVSYDSFLVQINDLPVTSGTTSLTIGTATFNNIAVR